MTAASRATNLAARILAEIDKTEQFYQLVMSRPRPPGGKPHGHAEMRRCSAERGMVKDCLEAIEDGSGVTSGAILGRMILGHLADAYGITVDGAE